jgi:hypothetical protein
LAHRQKATLGLVFLNRNRVPDPDDGDSDDDDSDYQPDDNDPDDGNFDDNDSDYQPDDNDVDSKYDSDDDANGNEQVDGDDTDDAHSEYVPTDEEDEELEYDSDDDNDAHDDGEIPGVDADQDDHDDDEDVDENTDDDYEPPGESAGVGTNDGEEPPVESAGVGPHSDTKDNEHQTALEQEMNAKYGPCTKQYNMRQQKPRDYSHLFATKGDEEDTEEGVEVETVEEEEEEPLATPQMSMKKGIRVFGQDGIAAVKKEMLQLHDRKVMAPKHAKELSHEQKQEALAYLMFLKCKRCGKIKGRGCANGWASVNVKPSNLDVFQLITMFLF